MFDNSFGVNLGSHLFVSGKKLTNHLVAGLNTISFKILAGKGSLIMTLNVHTRSLFLNCSVITSAVE